MTKLLQLLLGAKLTTAFLLTQKPPFQIRSSSFIHVKESLITVSATPISSLSSTDMSPTDETMSSVDSPEQEYSTLTLLEHVNLNIPNHEHALPFYVDLLGLGLDPRRAGNVVNGKGTVWVNCGASQFHLPFGEEAQKIPGSIGLIYNSLQPLKQRLQNELSKEGKEDEERCFAESEVGIDERSGKEYVKLVDRYGNVFFAREKPNEVAAPGSVNGMKQPLVSKSETEEFGEVASTYGMDESECIGISYVEILVTPKMAKKIAEFYESVFDAPVSVIEMEEGLEVAIVGFGNIDENGRTDQTLLFREKEGFEIPPYDGHHIALYVGLDSKDFEQAFKNCETAGIVWVNPRFSDKAVNLNTAKIYKQYRLKNILNIKTGKQIFELEHEIRCIEHEAWPGKKKN